MVNSRKCLNQNTLFRQNQFLLLFDCQQCRDETTGAARRENGRNDLAAMNYLLSYTGLVSHLHFKVFKLLWIYYSTVLYYIFVIQYSQSRKRAFLVFYLSVTFLRNGMLKCALVISISWNNRVLEKIKSGFWILIVYLILGCTFFNTLIYTGIRLWSWQIFRLNQNAFSDKVRQENSYKNNSEWAIKYNAMSFYNKQVWC